MKEMKTHTTPTTQQHFKCTDSWDLNHSSFRPISKLFFQKKVVFVSNSVFDEPLCEPCRHLVEMLLTGIQQHCGCHPPPLAYSSPSHGKDSMKTIKHYYKLILLSLLIHLKMCK